MGAGNAISGYFNSLDADHSQDQTAHHHHHHTQHTETEQAIPSILTLPAHCMFCIDGIAPEPAALAGCDCAHALVKSPCGVTPALAAVRPKPIKLFDSRAPPLV